MQWWLNIMCTNLWGNVVYFTQVRDQLDFCPHFSSAQSIVELFWFFLCSLYPFAASAPFARYSSTALLVEQIPQNSWPVFLDLFGHIQFPYIPLLCSNCKRTIWGLFQKWFDWFFFFFFNHFPASAKMLWAMLAFVHCCIPRA